MSILAFLPIIGKVLDRVLPNKEAAAAAQLKLAELAASGELEQLRLDTQLAVGQMEINKAEASHASVFVSGWRPFVGWICAAGMGSQFVLGPFAQWAAALAGHSVTWPQLDLAPLLTMLGGMLGLGTMRTIERVKGVVRQS